MNSALVIAALFTFAIPVVQGAAISIATSTTCSTSQGSVADPSSCNLAGMPNGSATADASASYSISGNTLTISLIDHAAVLGTVGSGSAQSSISLDILTAGSIRPGLVVPIGTGNVGGEGYDTPNGSEAVGYASLTSAVGFYCNGSTNTQCLIYSAGTDYPLSVMLGTDFDAYATAYATANVSALKFATGARSVAAVNFSFQFFEADGISPVDLVVATPEPSVGVITGILSLMVACISVRFKTDRYPHASHARERFNEHTGSGNRPTICGSHRSP